MNQPVFFVFLVAISAGQAQYGAPKYGAPTFGAGYRPFPPPPPPPVLINDYVCSIEGSYSLFGQENRNPSIPIASFCQDAQKVKSCDRCCRTAAKLTGHNIEESKIIGFHVVLRREPLCVCCTPNQVTKTSSSDYSTSTVASNTY